MCMCYTITQLVLCSESYTLRGKSFEWEDFHGTKKIFSGILHVYRYNLATV